MSKFIVKSRSEAANHESDGRSWAAIQIGTGDGDWPKITGVNRLGLLQLNFADADHEAYRERAERMGSTLFEDSHAEQILQFVNEHWDKVDYFLIHCTAGQSRSPAVAAAIQKIKGGDDSIWFSTKIPNVRVYRKLLDAAYRLGELVEAPNDLPSIEGKFNA
jgi:predicted protein tyrosine phosphatase